MAQSGTTPQVLCLFAVGLLGYGAVAATLGMPPGASRAVGLANGANPLAIVVPCHRVIGSNGKLSGYRWGVERKKAILENESVKRYATAVTELYDHKESSKSLQNYKESVVNLLF